MTFEIRENILIIKELIIYKSHAHNLVLKKLKKFLAYLLLSHTHTQTLWFKLFYIVT